MPNEYSGFTVPAATDLADGPQAFRDYTDDVDARLDAMDALYGQFRAFPTKAAMDAWAAPEGAMATSVGIVWLRGGGEWNPYRISGRDAAPPVGTVQAVIFDYPFPDGNTYGALLTTAGANASVAHFVSAVTRTGFQYKVNVTTTWVYWEAFYVNQVP
jgi:hypothetical protein